MHNVGGQGRKSIITNNMIHQMDRSVEENRHFTISNLAARFINILRSVLHRVIFKNVRVLCPLYLKIATGINKTQCVKSGDMFLECFEIKHFYRKSQQKG